MTVSPPPRRSGRRPLPAGDRSHVRRRPRCTPREKCPARDPADGFGRKAGGRRWRGRAWEPPIQAMMSGVSWSSSRTSLSRSISFRFLRRCNCSRSARPRPRSGPRSRRRDRGVPRAAARSGRQGRRAPPASTPFPSSHHATNPMTRCAPRTRPTMGATTGRGKALGGAATGAPFGAKRKVIGTAVGPAAKIFRGTTPFGARNLRSMRHFAACARRPMCHTFVV